MLELLVSLHHTPPFVLPVIFLFLQSLAEMMR